jgi:hypothetical protein
MVESTPFGAAVDDFIIEDKATVLAYQFGTFVILNELTATALRTDGLISLFCP